MANVNLGGLNQPNFSKPDKLLKKPEEDVKPDILPVPVEPIKPNTVEYNAIAPKPDIE